MKINLDNNKRIAGELAENLAPSKVLDYRGHEVYFDYAVELMDDDLREELHRELAPCSDQEFFTAYEEAHKEKYGTDFEI